MTNSLGGDNAIWRYGLYPQQVQGIDETLRPFYFRARYGDWQLWRGPAGGEPNYRSWADHGQLVAEGPDDGLMPDDIDVLLTQQLGRGWTFIAS
jgi:hypothetical protein